MPNTRIHKLLLGTKPDGTAVNVFTSVPCPTAPHTTLTDVTTTAQAANPSWKAYKTSCVELQRIDAFQQPGATSYHSLVLRGWTRCCCSTACPYPQDHGDSQTVRPKRGMTPNITVHGLAETNVESSLDFNQLAGHQVDASRAVATPAAATAAGQNLTAQAAIYGVTADEIQNFLPTSMLSGAGAVAAVLAGTSTTAADYFAVSVFLDLLNGVVDRVHSVFTRSWPNSPMVVRQ